MEEYDQNKSYYCWNSVYLEDVEWVVEFELFGHFGAADEEDATDTAEDGADPDFVVDGGVGDYDAAGYYAAAEDVGVVAW